MESLEYDNAMEHYYTLKAKYDKVLRKAKAKIKRSNDSIEEKRRKVKKLKRKCVRCRRAGGTIFTNDGEFLKVKCAAETPCKLHIEIKKSNYHFLPTEIEHNRKIVAELKQRIIIIKLEFLYDLEKEHETIVKFDKVKRLFESYFEHLTTLETLLEKNYNWGNRINEIEAARLQLYTYNEQFKEAINDFKKNDNLTSVKDGIQLYIDQILPLQKDVQNNQYARLYVDADDEESEIKFRLVSVRNSILQKEEMWEEGKVLSNIK
jgi:hypothetical protein